VKSGHIAFYSLEALVHGSLKEAKLYVGISSKNI